MGKQLSYIRLLASDYAATFNFYRNILNLDVKFGDDQGPYCEFETGSTDIGLYDRATMNEQTGLNLAHTPMQSNVMLIFPVDDVDTEYQRLKSQGIELLSKPVTRDAWDVRTFHLKDPEGNLVEINSRIR
ncbi:MAG: VOC family protein [Candidatus Kariarchaeaceae archaeon]|jgi:predicted enzyme related to lactoylglutathione lyase